MQYTADNLLIQPTSDDPNVIASVTRQQAGWKYISFQVQRFCLAARHAAIAPADALAHQLVAMHQRGRTGLHSQHSLRNTVYKRLNL